MFLANAVRNHREQRGESLQHVATNAGLTKSYIWDLEQGKTKNPTIDTIVRLSTALNLNPKDLFVAALEDWLKANKVRTEVVTRYIIPKRVSLEK